MRLPLLLDNEIKLNQLKLSHRAEVQRREIIRSYDFEDFQIWARVRLWSWIKHNIYCLKAFQVAHNLLLQLAKVCLPHDKTIEIRIV